MVYFPQAENHLSEFLIAGYQYFMENDFTGLTNSTAQVRAYQQQYGPSGLILYGHSPGGMTIGNALESLAAMPDSAGTLSDTQINLFGSAYNAQKAANLMDYLSGGAVTGVNLQNHDSDPIGSWLGRNPSGGYDKVTDGGSPLGESLYVIWGALFDEKTVHNCYGNGGPDCTKYYSTPVSQTIYTDRTK